MELNDLKLKRFAVANYRSVKNASLDNLENMLWLAGRNNTGKSNLLDAFRFVAEAATSLENALSSRGGDLIQVQHRKRAHLKMEFVFEFLLAPEKREELVRQLFAQNPQCKPEEALATGFLSTLTLKVAIGRDQVVEDLSTPNLRGERPFVIFSITSVPQKTDILYGQLETLCRACQDELPSELVAPQLPPEPSQPFRLRLGRPETCGVFAHSYELADGVRRQFTSLQWVSPASPELFAKRTHAEGGSDEASLPDILHWVYNNKPSLFRRIEAQTQKLIPRLGKLHTPTSRGETTLAASDPRDEELVFTLAQMSAGARSVVAMVTTVVLAAPGAWVCLEEPEFCLHPQAQCRLMQFLRAESATKRIFGVTHSPGIAGAVPLPSLFLIRRDSDHCTFAVPVTEDHALAAAEELGVGASFSFESDAVVFVEQAEHVPIFDVWAKKFGWRLNVQFLPCDNADTLQYLANVRIAVSRFVRTLVMAVFGNGASACKTVARQLELEEDQVVMLDFPELEGCLLEGRAVRKAFPTIPLSEADLERRFDQALTQLEQKKSLRDLLADYKIGEYDGLLGARIAEAMEHIPPDVAHLFSKIDARAKPFWDI